MNPGSGLADPHNLVVRPHPGGADGYINPATFRDIFAADLPRHLTDVMAASQRPADVGTLRQPSGPAAWATIPSWYVVASQDRTIPPGDPAVHGRPSRLPRRSRSDRRTS